jgi:hypothetical protein
LEEKQIAVVVVGNTFPAASVCSQSGDCVFAQLGRRRGRGHCGQAQVNFGDADLGDADNPYSQQNDDQM